MPAFAIPLIPLIWDAAAVAAGFIVRNALKAGVRNMATMVIDKALEKEEATDDTCPVTAIQDCSRPCSPCDPPAGTIAVERVDRVPPSIAHFPCEADHAHLVQMNQHPKTCVCFWNKAKPDVFCLEPGATLPYPSK